MTTTNAAAAEALAYLETQGFTRTGARLYGHPCGHAPVDVVDDQAACFTVYAFTRDRARLLLWDVRLTNAPLAVFAAAITAATA